MYRGYSDKEKGLKEAGLELGTKSKAKIGSNEKKRLYMDFTTEVKEEAEKDRSMKPGQEVVGTVKKLVPYGALVDIGANRLGLLHIKKVADLYGGYIDKEKGLKEAGLELGTKIKAQIESNEKKRLFLDFTTEVKEEAEKDRAMKP